MKATDFSRVSFLPVGGSPRADRDAEMGRRAKENELERTKGRSVLLISSPLMTSTLSEEEGFLMRTSESEPSSDRRGIL